VPSDDAPVVVKLTQDTRVYVKNTSGCCAPNDKVVHPGDDRTIAMLFVPGKIRPVCDGHDGVVNIDGISGRLGEDFSVTFGKSLTKTKTVKVEFVAEGVDPAPIMVDVEAGQDAKDVKCVAH